MPDIDQKLAEKKILLVEDDPFLRNLMLVKLQKEGFNVIEAFDGEDGLKKANEIKPSLILLDLILPGIDGFEVLKQIKNSSETASIPVIILSNLGSRVDVEKGLKIGAYDFMIKAHFTPEEIVEKIKNALMMNI
ncbi:MAG: Response regulator receiver protein [Parcubacteria group bacterium GW2011_GWC1_38_17]|nr:MAG: Response regulator receiver protein [Candidatus Moranbacteria bacterium GW2011_GWF2_37_7]KKQ42674.1 MAG: Response regulator receiver protein [Parcubacteria group bacterium GW2011_GWE2_37_8]KKQ58739.1 MAG: Response regulator receiver protein [Parcubacteria group bacterium GW2011_GWC1_38_17]